MCLLLLSYNTGKFRRRFGIMKELAQSEGKTISDYTLEKPESFWNIKKN